MIDERSGIYCITNLENGKKYIGQSKNIKNRRIQHLSELRGNYHSNEHLQNAWNIYGEENFRFEVLEYCPIELLDEKEIAYISKFKTTDRTNGYNYESGGSTNKQLHEETIEKISHSISKTQTSTGIYRVSKHFGETYTLGFRWAYRYRENNKPKQIERIDLLKLKEEIESRNLTWKIINKELASQSLKENELNKIKFSKTAKGGKYKIPKSGIYKVSESKGGGWRYRTKENNKEINIHAPYLEDLKQKIIKQNFEWLILDERLAGNSYKKDRIRKERKIPGNTGYYRVFKQKTKYAEQGFHYAYTFNEFDEKIQIISIDLEILKEKVKKQNYEWKIVNENKASKTFEENKKLRQKYPIKSIPFEKTNYFNVYKNTKKGIYVYKFMEGYEQKEITSISLAILEKRVKSKNLKWDIIDETKHYLSEEEKQIEIENYYNKIQHKQYNKTGFYRVSKSKCKTCEKGFRWKYTYKEKNKKKYFSSISLKELEQKVREKNLDWIILDEEQAQKSIKTDEKTIIKTYGNTGFNNVYKINCKKCDQGFKYEYKYWEQNKRKNIASVNLKNLEKKVKEKGLEWVIIDEELALTTLKEFQQKQKESPTPGNTNYFRVYENTVNGKPYYRYRYIENGEEYSFGSRSITELEKKVMNNNLEWRVINTSKPPIADNNINTANTTGIYKVSKQKCKSCSKGFRWRYSYKENGKTKEITSTNLIKLKEKVLKNQLEWKIIDEDKAKNSWKLDKS